MEAREKPVMKVSMSRSRFPTFLFTALVLLICIVTYTYWTTSSSNQELMRELRLIQGRKLETERKYDVLEKTFLDMQNKNRLLEKKFLDMQNKNRLLEDDLDNEQAIKNRVLKVITELKIELQTEREKINTALNHEVGINK